MQRTLASALNANYGQGRQWCDKMDATVVQHDSGRQCTNLGGRNTVVVRDGSGVVDLSDN
jgi:hypothetical protein